MCERERARETDRQTDRERERERERENAHARTHTGIPEQTLNAQCTCRKKKTNTTQGVSKLMRAHAMSFNHRTSEGQGQGQDGGLRGDVGRVGVGGGGDGSSEAACFG